MVDLPGARTPVVVNTTTQCAREDLNLHSRKGTRPSSVRVYQFRHSRVVGRMGRWMRVATQSRMGEPYAAPNAARHGRGAVHWSHPATLTRDRSTCPVGVMRRSCTSSATTTFSRCQYTGATTARSATCCSTCCHWAMP